MDKEYKQFVENRVKEIRQNVPPEVWNHCSGSQNPTDLPSCGMGSDVFKQSQIWWRSPFWPVKENKIWHYFGNSHEPSSAYFEEMHSKDNGKPTSGVLIDSSMISYRDFKKLM